MVSTSIIVPELSKRRHIIAYALLVVANVMFFSLTSPFESPSLVVIAGFVVAAFDIALIVHFLLAFICLLMPRLKPVRRRLTVTLVSFSVVCLALASLGQLTWRDVVVVVIIWLVSYLYSLRFKIGDSKTT